MTAQEIRDGLKLLRNYYAKDGQPHPLNDAQWAVYIAGLSPFTPEQIVAASHAWMRTSKWFPALSDLIALLVPKADATAAAHLAWTTVERAIRSAGAYRGVTFADGAIGECVRQVFGSWAEACAYDFDSPAWAIRRQTWLQVFPSVSAHATGAPVTLPGRFPRETPQLIAHVPGLPAPAGRGAESDGRLTQAEAREHLRVIEARRMKLVETRNADR